MLKIIIADDHAVVRQGIKQILRDGLAISEIAEVGNADEAIALVRQGVWDLMVLDITMPGRSGLEVLKEVKTLRPNLPILVLSMHPADALAMRVLRAGASGYLTKDSAPEELISAAGKVLSGGRYVSAATTETLILSLQGGANAQLHETLSDREYEVFRLISSGKTVSQIADMLSLSVKTVSTYRARVLSKMGLESNADLTQYAFRHGLIE